MDPCDKKKITRNIGMIKERIEDDIDPIMDRLIEKDMFTIQMKDEIDNVQPSTSQKKADSFIKKLLKCKQGAYPHFRDILLERGYYDLVQIMEGMQPRTNEDGGAGSMLGDRGSSMLGERGSSMLGDRGSSMLGERGSSFVLLNQNAAAGGAVGGAVVGAVGGGNALSMWDLERMVTSLVEKTFEQRGNELKEELATELNRQERNMAEVMTSRLGSAEEKIKCDVMTEVCEKESAIKETIKNDIEDKFAKSQIENETRLNAFDLTLRKLQELNEKYAHLQSVQDVLRKRIDEKELKIKEMHRQSFTSAKEYKELKYEADRLKTERCERDIELQQLKNELQMKDIEITRMKIDFDTQHLQLRQGFAEEQKNMKSGMKEQDKKLQRITKLMETIAKTYSPIDVSEAPKAVRKDGPKPFMSGSSTPSTSHNTFVKRHSFLNYRK